MNRSQTQAHIGSPLPHRVVPERLCLLIFLTSVVVSTLAPFDVSFSGPELLDRARKAVDVSSQGSLFNAVSHFVVFFVFGLLIVSVYDRSSVVRSGCGVVWAAVFCVVLESAQLFQEGRHARLSDVLANYTGLLVGGRMAVGWAPLRRAGAALQRWVTGQPVGFYAAVLLSATAIWWGAGFPPLLGGMKMDWNPDFPLLVGNETDGSRPWSGEVKYIGIYGRALSPEQIARVHDRLDARHALERRSELELLAGYDFTKAEGNAIEPAGVLASPNLVLHMTAGDLVRDPGGGVALEEGAFLISRGPAADLTAAITASDAFSVEAWVRPFNRAQGGPARVVSSSEGIWRRNFTLGQEGSAVVFRVRNRVNGPNGYRLELHVNEAVQDDLQHWVVVYDHGVCTLYVDGRPMTPVVDLRDSTARLGLGPGAAGRIAVGGLLTMALAIPLYAMLYRRIRANRIRHTAALMATFIIGCLPYASTSLLVGGPWRFGHFAWLGASLVILYPICFYYVCRPETHDRARTK